MKCRDSHDTTACNEARKGTGDTVLLEGIHACKHAIRFGAKIEVAYTNDSTRTLTLMRALAGRDEANALSAVLTALPQPVFAQCAPNALRAGLIALAEHPHAAGAPAVPQEGPAIFLENPRDLENVGAVIRVAAGFGAEAVLVSGSNNPWHSNCIHASAGLHFALPVLRVESANLPPHRPLIACTAEGENMYQATLPTNPILAFGTERHGLSAALRGKASQSLAIPMQPNVSSLNLATSVAAVLYGALRYG